MSARDEVLYAASRPGWPGYCAIAVCDNSSKYERRETAKMLAEWVRDGLVIERPADRQASVAGFEEYAAERKRRDALPKPAPAVDALPLFGGA